MLDYVLAQHLDKGVERLGLDGCALDGDRFGEVDGEVWRAAGAEVATHAAGLPVARIEHNVAEDVLEAGDSLGEVGGALGSVIGLPFEHFATDYASAFS
jgi:hypothetical protein